MNAIPGTLMTSQSAYGSAFARTLSSESLQHAAPAVFAPSAHERLTAAYTFVPTGRVLDALAHAGFFPVEARQTRTRTASPLHARHLIRLRRRFETVALREAVPELWRAAHNSGYRQSPVMSSGSVRAHLSGPIPARGW